MFEKERILREEFLSDQPKRVVDALAIAAEIHKNDKRKTTGEPYLNHCIAVAHVLESWGADEDQIVAGLLHDTVEDHPDLISLEKITELFGERVSFLVDGVTKFKSREGGKNEFETLRKVTRGSLLELGVALIKLADRYHNMITMDGMPAEVQRKKAKEVLDVYAPLAESLGLWQVKKTLEDLAFQYIDPQKYLEVKEQIDKDPRLKSEFVDSRKKEIEDQLIACGIKARVKYQIGGYWEIAEKQKRLAIRANTWSNSFSAITDVISFRVLTDDDNNIVSCYQAMGAMRLRYADRLEKRRHDDYISSLAINGYSAIHDTYKYDEGNIEIAFTTEARERFNNWGVASLSSEELRNNPDKYRRKLIFTPKKELVFMELSATGIDVAYRLNPFIGLRAVGVKIDGKMFDLEAVVPNAGLVEIVTDQNQTRPNKEWLGYCNLMTRRSIEQQLAVVERDEIVDEGKSSLVEKILIDRGVLDLADLNEKILGKLLTDLGCWYGLNDLYYKVASGLDLEIVRKKLDEMGIIKGMYTTVQIRGENEIGISKTVASVVTKHGGDARTKVERVDEEDRFVIRILMTVSYEGKKKIEEELRRKYRDCVVV